MIMPRSNTGPFIHRMFLNWLNEKETAEQTISKPVISSNSAFLWALQKALGRDQALGPGILFDH